MKSKLEFRVFVDLKVSPQFFDVLVWPTKKELEKFRWEGKKPPSNTEAYWSPNNDELTVNCHCGDKHRKNLPMVGTIHFHRGCLTFGIIAHEAFHAIMSWAVINGADPVVSNLCKPDGNEICATIHGRLVAGIIDQIQKAKLKIINA